MVTPSLETRGATPQPEEVPVLDFVNTPEWRAQLVELNRLRLEITLLKRLAVLTQKFTTLHSSLLPQLVDLAAWINESTPSSLKQEFQALAQTLLLETLSPQLENSENSLMVWVGAEIIKPPTKKVVILETAFEDQLVLSWLAKAKHWFKQSLTPIESTTEEDIPVSFAWADGSWHAMVTIKVVPQDTDLGLDQRDVYTLTFQLKPAVINKRLEVAENDVMHRLAKTLEKIRKTDLIDTITGGHTRYIKRKKEIWSAIFSLEQLLFFEPLNEDDQQLQQSYQGKWLTLPMLLDRLHDSHDYESLEKNLAEYFIKMGSKRQLVAAELQSRSWPSPAPVLDEEVAHFFEGSERVVIVRFFTDYFQVAIRAQATAEPVILTLPFMVAQQVLAETEVQRMKLLEWDTMVHDLTEQSDLYS